MTPIESLPAKLEACGDCGMPCAPGEFHPYAACLMFKACHNSETVRASLQALAAQPKDGALLASLLNRPNRVWRSESETGTEELARGIVIDPIELRTLASRRVTDEAHRCPYCAGRIYTDAGCQNCKRGFSVTAALQPDSGDKD